MHILIIPYNYPTVEFPQRAIFIQDQVKALTFAGNTVNVLGCIPTTLSDMTKTKSLLLGRVKGLPWLSRVFANRWLQMLNQEVAFYVGKQLFKQYIKLNTKPDVIHVHNASVAKLALWIKQNYAIPYVVTEHSSKLWSMDKFTTKNFDFYTLVYEQSLANIAVSESFANHLTQTFKQTFHYIPNVVDTDFFTLKKVQEKPELNKSIRLISVGNLTKNKNHQLAIRAVHKLIKDGYNINYVIAGEGSERANLQDLIQCLGLTNNVSLLGAISRENVKVELQQSDYFILPSIKETFGVVLIEALSCGLPVLALNNGGSDSIVNSDVGANVENGQLFSQALETLFNHNFVPENLRAYAIRNFSNSAVANQLMTIYEECKA